MGKSAAESLQAIVGDWWTSCKLWPLRRGQLAYAFLNHVDLVPYTLEPIGRTDARQHDRADVQITRARVSGRAKTPTLPVAALPQHLGETWTVHRSKRRPCLIVGCGWDLELSLRGSVKWQTAPTVLVAPYYGAAQTEKRAGFSEQLLRRIRRCEYPQYMLDALPLNTGTPESVLRFDHIQPVGAHRDSIEPTEHCLTPGAAVILEQWLDWLVRGSVPLESDLAVVRDGLMDLDE